MMNLPLSPSAKRDGAIVKNQAWVTSPLCRLPPRIRDRNPVGQAACTLRNQNGVRL